MKKCNGGKELRLQNIRKDSVIKDLYIQHFLNI